MWGRIADSRARKRVRELVDDTGGGVLVEAGCGTGVLLIELARANVGGTTLGFDLAPGMVAEATRRLRREQVVGARARQGDIRALDLGDDSVDTLTSSYVLDILPAEEIRTALDECSRVLRPGGRLVMVNCTPAETRRHRVPELLYGSGLPLTANCRAIRLAPILKELGFIEVEREYLSQIGLPSEIVRAVNPNASAVVG